MNVPVSRMTVIPHGVEDRFLRAGGREEESEAPAIRLPKGPFAGVKRRPFFLVVGHSKPHKNCARVVGALALLAERLPEVEVRFVGRGEGYDQLRAQAATLGLGSRVHLLRNAPDEGLLALYREAIALVMPSLVEGFGLPVLEAQAVGCPVITSNRGALAETAGDAALLVDPLDSWNIAAAMERVYRDRELRASLVERGRIRAEEFTWEKTAARTRAVYDLLMDHPVATDSAVGNRLSPQVA
jgi:glycosyltransferase involved in cell wall biosynthesis